MIVEETCIVFLRKMRTIRMEDPFLSIIACLALRVIRLFSHHTHRNIDVKFTLNWSN